MGIAEVLTVVFIVLKLIGKIDWSWWLVLLPEIIAIVLYLAIYFIAAWQQVTVTRTVKSMFKEKK